MPSAKSQISHVQKQAKFATKALFYHKFIDFDLAFH